MRSQVWLRRDTLECHGVVHARFAALFNGILPIGVFIVVVNGTLIYIAVRLVTERLDGLRRDLIADGGLLLLYVEKRIRLRRVHCAFERGTLILPGGTAELEDLSLSLRYRLAGLEALWRGLVTRRTT